MTAGVTDHSIALGESIASRVGQIGHKELAVPKLGERDLYTSVVLLRDYFTTPSIPSRRHDRILVRAQTPSQQKGIPPPPLDFVGNIS